MFIIPEIHPTSRTMYKIMINKISLFFVYE